MKLIVGFLLLMLGIRSAVFAAEVPSWQRSLQNPIAAPVRFYGEFIASGRVSVSLGGETAAITNHVEEWICGDTFSGLIDTPMKVVDLEIYKTYNLIFSGQNVYDAKVYLYEPRLHDLLAGKGRNAQQYNRYRLYLRKPGDVNWTLLCKDQLPGWNAEDPSTGGRDEDYDCESMSSVYEVQVRPDLGARPVSLPGLNSTYGTADPDVWDRDEDPAKGGSAPGDEDALTIAADKSSYSTDRMSIMWGVNLGRLRDGRTAGKLRIIESSLANVFSPACLVYGTRSDDTNELDVVITNTPASLTQIRAPQACVDVVTLSGASYQMRFYETNAFGSKTNGLYPVAMSAMPFVIWQVDNNGVGSDTLRIQEIRNGRTNQSILAFSGTNLWTLTRGEGSEARIVTRAVTLQPEGTNHVHRIEVEEVKDGTGQISSKTGEFWQDMGGTHELTIVTNGVGDAELVTTFDYDGIDGSLQMTYSRYPDGYWEKRRYETSTSTDENHPYGGLVRIVQPWKDSPTSAPDNDCLVTSYLYPAPWIGAGEGSFELQRWHDAASLTEDPDSNYVDKVYSATYEEETFFDDDSCSEQEIVQELRQFGDLEHYGEVVSTKTFGPVSGRLSGQLFAKQEGAGKLDSYDYLFGEWNRTNHTFSAGGSNTNDLAQIIYHGTSWYLDTADYLEIGESGSIVEGVYLHRGKSTKEVRIISSGSLVAKQLYVYVDPVAGFSLLENVEFQRDILAHLTNIVRYPAGSAAPQILYQADWIGGSAYPGDRKLSETDKYGAKTIFSYDSLKRVKSSIKEGMALAGYPTQPAITNIFDYDASANVLTSTTFSGQLVLKSFSAFDRAGRLTNSISVDGFATQYEYLNGGRQTNITYSSGATQITENYIDRRIKSVTGSAVVNHYYGYELSGDGYVDHLYPKNVTIVTNGNPASTRWSKSITDHRNHVAKETWPAFRSAGEKWVLHNENGLGGLLAANVESGWDPDAYYIETKFDRDEFGAIAYTASDGDGYFGAETTPGGPDRVRQSREYFEADSQTNWFRVNEELTFPNDGSALATLVSRTRERLTGFATNQLSQTYSYDADTNETIVTVTVELENKLTTTVTTNQQSSLAARQVSLNGVLQTETTSTVAAPTWHLYDALAREIARIDPLGFVTGTCYGTNNPQVLATTNRAGKVTGFAYFPAGHTNAGLLYSETGPTAKKTYHAYNLRGQEIQTWGDVPYPVLKSFNDFGDLATQTTYRTADVAWNSTNWPSPAGGDVTTWLYDEPTGLLTNKLDAAGQGEKYDYYVNHFPKATLLARGLGRYTTYAPNGDLMQIDLTNDWTGTIVVSSQVFSNYNRLGLPTYKLDEAGEHLLAYDHAGRVLSESYTNGLLSGTVWTYHYDPVYGRDRFVVSSPSGTLITNIYGFDAYGRIGSVGDGGSYSAAYSYVPNSDLIETTTSKAGATNIHSARRTWEYGYRLKALNHFEFGRTYSKRAYDYDDLDRRYRMTMEDGSVWNYTYNDRGELLSGKRSWSDGTPVSGQQFEYNYDQIGNRTNAFAGGDVAGTNLREFRFEANQLNQLTQVATPGYKDIVGAASASTNVIVNGGTADRKNDYFHREITVANTGGPVWQNVTNTSAGTTLTGSLIVPDDDQMLLYDLDGNLTSDGVWNYEWTVENRLASMNMTNIISGLANSNRLKVDFIYDHEGHRVGKIVSAWDGSAFVNPATNRFINDGWKVVAELASNGTPTRSYMWGLDLSNDLESAGGIGGLLMFRDHLGATYHFTVHDGSGNLVALVNAGDQSTSARYEYSPFLEPIRASGPMARINAIWGSSKFRDLETDLLYFGERYLGANGRWLNRDPEEEEGGSNLHAFVANSPVNLVDPHGTMLLDFLAATSADVEGKAAELATKTTYVQRVRAAVENMENLQMFLAGIQEADDNRFIDMIDQINQLQGLAAEGFRGPKSMANRGHHLTPKAKELGEFFRNASIIPDNFIKDIPKWQHDALHELYKGGDGRGGPWNEIWRRAAKDRNNQNWKNKYFVAGFAAGIVKRTAVNAVPGAF